MSGKEFDHTPKDIEEAVAEFNSFPPEAHAVFILDFAGVTPEVMEQLRLLHPDWFEPEPEALVVWWYDPGKSQEGPETGM